MKKKNVSVSKLNLNKTTLKNLQTNMSNIIGGDKVSVIDDTIVVTNLPPSINNPGPVQDSTQAPCANYSNPCATGIPYLCHQ